MIERKTDKLLKNIKENLNICNSFNSTSIKALKTALKKSENCLYYIGHIFIKIIINMKFLQMWNKE